MKDMIAHPTLLVKVSQGVLLPAADISGPLIRLTILAQVLRDSTDLVAL